MRNIKYLVCLSLGTLYDSENNNNLPTVAEFDYKPYGIDTSISATGRFTNGRTAIDIITNILSV